MPKKTAVPKISTGEVFALAAEYEQAHKTEAQAKKKKVATQEQIVTEIQRRKLSSLESDKFGGFTRITLVQAESVVYHEDDLYKELTPAQRREAFDFMIDISVLSPAERKALNEKLIELLTPAQRKAARIHRLNVDKLSQAVQDGKIAPETAAKHSEIRKNAPYISISHGSGK